MAQAKLKTQATDASVGEFLAGLADTQQRADSEDLVRLMTKVSGEPPVLWGPSIVGFGRYHYKYDSGREGDMCALGFSPRKGTLTVYLAEGAMRNTELMGKLGPHKTGKVCLYIKRLADVDMGILEQLVRSSYENVMAHMDATHGAK